MGGAAARRRFLGTLTGLAVVIGALWVFLNAFQPLALRGLRIGAINYHVEFKAAQTMRSRVKVLARMLGKLPWSLFRAARLLLTEDAVIALHPVAVAAGSALAAFT